MSRSLPLLAALLIAAPVVAADDLPLRIVTTPGGVRFGLLAEKPAKPAPTLFIFATSLEGIQKYPYFCEVGVRLLPHGFVPVVVEPPCHGADAKPGEPPELRGWRYRVEHDEPLMPPFVDRARQVLDHLVAEGYTDEAWVAASGTSRGGFCALHFAAAEPRVRAIVCISPVTDPAALSEFRGLEEHPATVALSAVNLADKLAGRPVWISIGNNDARVSTDAAITLSRKLVAAGLALKPNDAAPVVPVELIIGPSGGHRAIDDAYKLAAEWLLRQM